VGELRSIAPPFVASGLSGVAVPTRLKHLTPSDEKVLRLVGAQLGSLASKDLKARCRDGLSHSGEAWAVRKRELTPLSSSRWAGSITKATHDQWALARRCQSAHLQNLEAGIRTIEHRLSLPPAPLAYLANAPRGRYVLACRVVFAHRGGEWADRVAANRAIAYRIHLDTGRDRWYLTASWQIQSTPTLPIEAALAHGVVGVDMNADHLAAWRLDVHGNPTGSPRRFFYDLTGTAEHRDAQVRHALTRLLHWAHTCGVRAIAVEDLDFTAEKTREKHGRKKRFRQLISGMPTGKLRARLSSMADRTGIAVIAVDPAYTSRWGAQHWQKPLTTTTRKTTRHDAAAVAIGRRAQQHPIRRRTAPPPHDRSDRAGHRTVQARRGVPGREGTRPRIPGPRTRSVGAGRGANAGNQNAQHRPGRSAEHGFWQQDSLPLSL
jgi:IS605 OrfB family transposase